VSLLATQGLAKSFGGMRALDGVTLGVEAGSITGLIGPNGAGKTTFFATVSGFLTPDRGTVSFAGADVTGAAPHRLAALGLARTFQIVQPFRGLTVLENIAVGAHLRLARRADAMALARRTAERLGLAPVVDRPADSLTVAFRKRLELARALATTPRLLLLDEVLAGLNPSEIEGMLPILRAVRDEGVTILMIEHVMQAVMQLCEVVWVLNHGRLVARGSPAEIARDAAVIEAYLGHGVGGLARAGEP
jgi:branched-chain amino acid transport system ATP-binding protein